MLSTGKVRNGTKPPASRDCAVNPGLHFLVCPPWHALRGSQWVSRSGQASVGNTGLLRFAPHRAFRMPENQWSSAHCPWNSNAGVPHRAGLRGGPGGRPQGARRWVQAWPGVRTLAVSPHLCDLSPIFQGPVIGNCYVFSILSHSWPPCSLFLLSGSSSALLNQMQASCLLGIHGVPSTILYWILSSGQLSR